MKSLHRTAVAFHRALKSGSSLPLLVSDEIGDEWIVKPTGSGDGVAASAAERIAMRLASALEIPTPETCLIHLESSLAPEDEDPEVRELIERSVGVNFAVRWFENARPLRADDAIPEDSISEDLRDRVFLYDLFLLNPDRTAANPNLVLADGRLVCLDYGASMLLRGLIANRRLDEEPFLRQLKRHPFYRPKPDRHGFIKRLRTLDRRTIADAVAGLPDAWGDVDKIVDGLTTAAKQAHKLSARLDRMRTMIVESDEERRARSLRNREAFERTFKAVS